MGIDTRHLKGNIRIMFLKNNNIVISSKYRKKYITINIIVSNNDYIKTSIYDVNRLQNRVGFKLT